MKQNLIAKSLLAGSGISVTDAARLTLEAIEDLGELATRVSRPELVTLLRRVIQAGVAAVKAAEHTVSLSVAAWASVEARKDLRPTMRRDLRHFVRRILRVEGAADMPLRSMSTADCKRILAAAFGASPGSWRWATAIPRCCARATWYPSAENKLSCSGKEPNERRIYRTSEDFDLACIYGLKSHAPMR